MSHSAAFAADEGLENVTVEYSRDGASWSQTPIGATQVSESGTVYYRVTADNYSTVNGSVRITIAPKQLDLAVAMEGWTVGSAANAPTLTGDAEGLSVSYHYVGTTADGTVYDSAEAPTEAGNYMVYAVVEGGENYSAVGAPAAFSIETPAPAKEGGLTNSEIPVVIVASVAAAAAVVGVVAAVVVAAVRKRK